MRWCSPAVIAALALAATTRAGPSSRSSRVLGDRPSTCSDDPTFVYDAVSRFNETLVGTIDAVDNSLTALLAGDVAVLVFTIDKIAVLQQVVEAVALGLLGTSIVAAVVGYVFGFRFGDGVADGVRPRHIVRDLAKRRDESIVGAIEQMIAAGDINLKLRSAKRILAAVSAVFLLAGLVLVLIARLTGGVL
jgi:hypothetical protein